MKKLLTIIAVTAALMVTANAEPAYGSRQGLNKQAALYGQIYKEEGDAYVGGDLETYYASKRLLYTMDRYAATEYGKKWQIARDREIKRIDAFHAAHIE